MLALGAHFLGKIGVISGNRVWGYGRTPGRLPFSEFRQKLGGISDGRISANFRYTVPPKILPPRDSNLHLT